MKAFKIKNGLSAKRYLGNSTTLSGSTIDLSLGSMFSTTLSSDPAYTFTNPPASGNAQAFSVEVTGGTTTFTQDSFATTLYTGNNTDNRDIVNGIDLANDGGMVWTKSRSNTYDHSIADTERGIYKILRSSSDAAEVTDYYEMVQFNSDGYRTMWALNTNTSPQTYVSWTFKKQAKFFDIVTWTGDGVSGRTISHSLNSEVGFYVVKRLDASGDWRTYHRVSDSASNPNIAYLNGTSGGVFESDKLTATSTTFTIEGAFNGAFNSTGQTYVAYLFAHDTASDSRIKCGSYTGVGSGAVDVDLGWGPQFVLTKNASRGTTDWMMQDTTRGMSDTSWNPLVANKTQAELGTSVDRVVPTATGFTVNNDGGSDMGQSGDTVVYMAIRASTATDSAITWPSSVKWPSGVAPTTPAPGTKDLFTFLTTDGGTTYYGKKAAEGLA
jgi:hypothetical protein